MINPNTVEAILETINSVGIQSLTYKTIRSVTVLRKQDIISQGFGM